MQLVSFLGEGVPWKSELLCFRGNAGGRTAGGGTARNYWGEGPNTLKKPLDLFKKNKVSKCA